MQAGAAIASLWNRAHGLCQKTQNLVRHGALFSYPDLEPRVYFLCHCLSRGLRLEQARRRRQGGALLGTQCGEAAKIKVLPNGK